MADSDKASAGLTFVVTTNPFDGSSAANKKQVRSIAALKSWPERRRRTFEQFEGSSSHHGGFVLEKTQPSTSRVTRNKSRIDSATSRRKRTRLGATTTNRGTKSQDFIEPPLFEKCLRTVDGQCQCVHCHFDRTIDYYPPRIQRRLRSHRDTVRGRRLSLVGDDDDDLVDDGPESSAMVPEVRVLTPPTSPSLPSPSIGASSITRAEPFNCYPVPNRPWFDRILHHMMNVYCPRGWPALRMSPREGLRWERFMTQAALSEPALFYVCLLFGSGDLINLNALDPKASYWLKEQAIMAMNEALVDPVRATSEAIILASGRIALYEFQYGDKHASNRMHRPAQARMIALRGGMRALDIPPLVKRLMRWSDTVMATQTGTPRMLEDDDTSPNYTLNETVAVLEEWAPSVGEDLRRKINIGDLLSPEPSSPGE